MSSGLRRFVEGEMWLASLAYASRMKRAGRGYYAVAIAAMFTSVDDPAIIYAGRMPSAVTSPPRDAAAAP